MASWMKCELLGSLVPPPVPVTYWLWLTPGMDWFCGVLEVGPKWADWAND